MPPCIRIIPFLNHWYTHRLLSDVSLSERGCEGLYGEHETLSYNIYKTPYACCQELGLANLSEYRIRLIKHTQSLTGVLRHLRFQHTKVAQLVLQQYILTDRNLLCNSLNKHTHKITKWLSYTACFSKHSSPLQQVCQQETRPSVSFLYQVNFCTCSHFFTSSINSSSHPNLFSQMAPSRAPMRWKPEAARSGLYGGQDRRVIASRVFKFVCGCELPCWRRISATFLLRSNSPEELLQVFKSLNVHIWVNGLTTQHNVYQNQTFCIPKMVAMIFQLKG